MGKPDMVERVLTLPGTGGEPSLLLRCCAGTGHAVLYVHGATFPSALSVGYRFAGRSWLDDLAAHGFDAWAFDFAGYGGSDRYAGMDGPREGAPLGRADEVAKQIARVVDYVIEATGCERVSLIAHSWGSVPAALYATQHPERVDALCLFGPIAQRTTPGLPLPESAGAWRQVTVAEQLARFVGDVPAGQPREDEEANVIAPSHPAHERAGTAEGGGDRNPSPPSGQVDETASDGCAKDGEAHTPDIVATNVEGGGSRVSPAPEPPPDPPKPKTAHERVAEIRAYIMTPETTSADVHTMTQHDGYVKLMAWFAAHKRAEMVELGRDVSEAVDDRIGYLLQLEREGTMG